MRNFGYYIILFKSFNIRVFVGFIPINLYIDLKLNNVQFISVLTSYTIMGYISSRYLTRYLNYKFLSEICLVIFLIIYTFQNIIAITIAILFLGISSGLTRPQTINELSNSSNLAAILNYAETLYFIFNIAFYLLVVTYIQLELFNI